MADAGCQCVYVVDSAGALGAGTGFRPGGRAGRRTGRRRAGRVPRAREPRAERRELGRWRSGPGHSRSTAACADSARARATRRSRRSSACCDKLGIETGVDFFKIVDAAEDVVRPVMPEECLLDRMSLMMGYAGVYSSFLKHAYTQAERYGVSGAQILVRAGRTQARRRTRGPADRHRTRAEQGESDERGNPRQGARAATRLARTRAGGGGAAQGAVRVGEGVAGDRVLPDAAARAARRLRDASARLLHRGQARSRARAARRAGSRPCWACTRGTSDCSTSEAQDEVWADDQDIRISSSYAPVGRATPVDGGFRFSGKWSFSSGCDHATWVLLGGLVMNDEGKPVDFRTFLLPISGLHDQRRVGHGRPARHRQQRHRGGGRVRARAPDAEHDAHRPLRLPRSGRQPRTAVPHAVRHDPPVRDHRADDRHGRRRLRDARRRDPRTRSVPPTWARSRRRTRSPRCGSPRRPTTSTAPWLQLERDINEEMALAEAGHEDPDRAAAAGPCATR